jgi:putative peptidoglycan lipid II flippase
VLSASFIPVYSRLLAEGRHEEAWRVAGAIAGLIAAAAAVVTVVGVLLAEPLTLLVAPGFAARPETFALTVDLVRLLFPAVGFLVLSAWCLGVLNSHRRFFLSYIAPVVLNVVQVAVLVGVGSRLALDWEGREPAQVSLVTWLAVGTVVGGVLQFLVQLPAVLRLSRELRPSLRTDLPDVRVVLRTFVPVVTGRGVVQLSNYLQIVLGSFLAAGALAQLRYAQILYALPISLFAVAVAAAELPELSRGGAERAAVTRRLQAGLARIAAYVLPTCVAYVVVGDLVTGALFQTGAFGRREAVAVWIVLAGYTVGLLASTFSRLLQSALYAAGDARTPARTAVLRVALSSVLGVVLMVQLDRFAVTPDGVRLLGDLPALGPLAESARDESTSEGVVRLGAAGLAVAAGLAAWVEYVLLRRAVRRQVVPTTLAGGQLRQLLLAGVATGLAGLAARPLATDLPPLAGGALALAVTGVTYVVAARLLGVDEVARCCATSGAGRAPVDAEPVYCRRRPGPPVRRSSRSTVSP